MADTTASVIVKVKRIVYTTDSGNYSIFIGETLVPYKRRTGYKATGETNTYSGSIRSVIVDDVYDLEVLARETKRGEMRFIMSYKRIFPGTLKDIAEYLMSRKKGIGEKRTRALVDKWGLNTLSEILHNPDAFNGLGIPKKSAAALRAEILKEQTFEDLVCFLQTHKLNHRIAVPLFNAYGADALDVLRTNPYSAYMKGHIDFCSADFLFLYFGGKMTDFLRLTMGLLETVRRDMRRNGNLYMTRSALIEKLSCTLKERARTFTDNEIDRGIASLIENNILAKDTAAEELLYLSDNYRVETKTAERIKTLMSAMKAFYIDPMELQVYLDYCQKTYSAKLSKEQMSAVHIALESPISIITGGPGTGKSQTINMIIQAARELEPNAKIRLAAPTGKAANRMTELCNYPARTLHRMLGLGEGYSIEVGEGELSGDIIIVDEYSMVDAELNYRLLLAMNPRSRLVIVGDYDQIPSVGPGLILRDLIESHKIPSVRFTKVFRQTEHSKIITNANRIIGRAEDGDHKLTLSRVKTGDFFFHKEMNTDAILDHVVETVREQMRERNLSVNDVQVLSPLKAPAVGVSVLNNRLQAELNPNGEALSLEDKEFRVGDKVIHVVNNYRKKVFNGETGIVKSIDFSSEEVLTVAFPDKEISYTIRELENELELSYAISVHKAQGSEFPVVVMPIHSCLASGLNRNILYTAITRARSAIYLVGDSATLVDAIHTDGIIERNSLLKERLLREKW